MIVIRRFMAEEWRLYRDLRLRALADSPDAFGSTYEAESQRSDDHWQRRLQDAADVGGTLPLVAVEEGEAIGLCWGKVDAEDAGLAHVFQMWVAPDSRGQGVASRLLGTVLEWAEGEGVRRVTLNVACGNLPASRIYTRAGFVPYGDVRPLREGSGVQVQPMILMWDDSAAGT